MARSDRAWSFKYLSSIVSWIFEFKTTVTGDAKTPERYFEIAKTCIEQAGRISARSAQIGTGYQAKFNSEQCKYLADKLRLAVESAKSFLELINREYFWFPEPENTASRLEIFQLLYVLSKEVETFIEDCCKDGWLQAAVLSSNVSGHISSIGFSLELCAIIFYESRISIPRRSLTPAQVDGIFRAEVRCVNEKASVDKASLSKKLKDLLQTKKPSTRDGDNQLAALVLERLERARSTVAHGDSPDSSFRSRFSKTKFSCTIQDTLGEGAFATVYKGSWLGVEVAVKKFEGYDNSDFDQEVSVLRGLSHPNIIPLLWCSITNRHCSIVMEKMDKDLHSLIQSRLESRGEQEAPFDILEVVDILLQIGGGMCYLHEMMIVHRDLKSMNILVRCKVAAELEIEHVVAKVADFGLSKFKERSTCTHLTQNVGTTRWMAPELIKTRNSESQEIKASGEASLKQYPFKVDVYSFGMVGYELLTGSLPFSGMKAADVIVKVLAGNRPMLPDGCPASLKSLIERCWSQDARMRPCFADICAELRHLRCLLLMPSALEEIPPTLSNHASPSARDDTGTPDNTPRRGHFKYLVGLDFGTTHSGFAYIKVPHLDQVYTVHNEYPSLSDLAQKPHCKTLTALYYKPAEGLGTLESTSWGYVARSSFLADLKSQNNLQGFYVPDLKRFLSKKPSTSLSDELQSTGRSFRLPYPLTVSTIITDYLKNICEYVLRRIMNHDADGESFSRDSVLWCVTVPSIWDVSEKEQMIKACMVKAGIVSDEGSGKILQSVKVVLEPEAASFHCHQILQQNLQEDVSLHVDDKILVVDIGGGTVDIVAQEVIDSGSNFKVREFSERSRGPFGGTLVDESFFKHLSKKVGCLQEYLVSDPSYRLRLFKRWEEIKCVFGLELMSDTETMDIGLHASLAAAWEAYEREHEYPRRESYREIELSEEDVKSIFDPVVDEILKLIAAELKLVPDIKVMFVVGGFAASSYLMQKIRARFSDEVAHIFIPPNPGSAIMEGAISLALSQDAIVAGTSRNDSRCTRLL